MSERVIIYTLASCPTCRRAKEDLAAAGVAFEERDVNADPRWYEEATALAVSVPVIVWPDRVEVGWKGDHG